MHANEIKIFSHKPFETRNAKDIFYFVGMKEGVFVTLTDAKVLIKYFGKSLCKKLTLNFNNIISEIHLVFSGSKQFICNRGKIGPLGVSGRRHSVLLLEIRPFLKGILHGVLTSFSRLAS